MKVELENLRLGPASLTNRVFAGTLSKDGKTWLHKTDVTNDFLATVIARWVGQREEIKSSDGKVYEIMVKEVMPEKEYGRRNYQQKHSNKQKKA